MQTARSAATSKADKDRWRAIRTRRGCEPDPDGKGRPWFRPGHDVSGWEPASNVLGGEPSQSHPLLWAARDIELAAGTNEIVLRFDARVLRAYVNGLLVADRMVHKTAEQMRVPAGALLPETNRIGAVIDGRRSADRAPIEWEEVKGTAAAGSRDWWSPPGVYVWDPWPAQNEESQHMFFLHSSRAAFDATQRHQVANIGRATASARWTGWTYDGGMLTAGAPGAWDHKRVVTSSIMEHAGRWHMLYTGDGAEFGQGTGVAVSDDLENWGRLSPEPAIRPDGKVYRTGYPWADGFIFQLPGQDDYLLLVKAEALRSLGADCGPGCVGAAQSTDLVKWELLPPFYYPGDFKHVEVPRLYAMDGKFVLLFSTMPQLFAPTGVERLAKQGEKPEMGDYYVVADSLAGPWSDPRKLIGPGGRIVGYGANLMQDRDGWAAIWWHTGRMALSPPHHVSFDGERLTIGEPIVT